jgi:predicted membrane channel-forming protein YqfA (hemolysin III family)
MIDTILDLILALLQLGLAAFVFIAALCRLGPMHVTRHKLLWVAVYMAMAAGAVVAVYEVANSRASWSTVLFGAAVGLYLWGSRNTWRHGVPSWLTREES